MFFRKRKERSRVINVRSEKPVSSWKKRGETGFWSRLFFGIVFISFLGVIVYSLFFSHFLLIRSVAVGGTVNVDPETIREMAQKELDGQYIRYLEKSNIVIFNAGKIKREIVGRFKIIDKIEIRRKFPDKIAVAIIEKDPALVVSGADRCFIADKDGIVFDEADCGGKYLGRDDFSVLVNERSREIALGESYIDAEYVDFVLASRSGIESDLEIPLEKEMRTPGIVSSDIKMKTKEGWDIFLNEKLSAGKELEMLQVVLENKISAEQRKNLGYIDLRTENRVYYKFKNSETTNQGESKEIKVTS